MEPYSKIHQSTAVRAENVQAITPHNQALYEAGRQILVDSINTTRNFCQFMISASTGAIPIYVALIKFVLPDKYRPSTHEALAGTVPAVLLLLATVIFTLGYFPRRSNFSLDVIEEIQDERNKIIDRRQRFAVAGFAIFFLAVLAAVTVAAYAMAQRAS